MKKYRRKICCLFLYLTVICTLPTRVLSAQSVNQEEEKAIRDLVARFYEGWNTHDVNMMVSVYAEDIDHINAFGEWHKGKQAMKEELTQFHAGPAKNSHKTCTIEKIRFIKPDVAVALVRQISTVGNVGTFVLSKESGKWLVVSFANVPYELKPPETKATEKAKTNN